MRLLIIILTFFLLLSSVYAVSVENIEIYELGNDGFVVGWSTDEPASSQLLYGTSGRLGGSTGVDTSLKTDHQVQINGLDDNTVYFFRATGSSSRAEEYFSVIGVTKTSEGSSSPSFGLEGYYLVNTDTDQKIRKLIDGETIDLSSYLHPISVIAEPVGDIESGLWFIDGEYVRTENFAPYSVNGDRDIENILPWYPESRSYTLRADLYSEDSEYNNPAGGVGEQGQSESITITFVNAQSTPTQESFTQPTEIGDRNYDIGTCRVGDGCMEMLDSCYDTRYPNMKEWEKAGVQGGIPDDLPIVKRVSPGTNNLQREIDEVARTGGGVIELEVGTYRITQTVNMKDNVVLRGLDKEDVILESTIRSNGKTKTRTIHFQNGVEYAGLEDLTIFYRVDNCEPPDDISLGLNPLPNFYQVYHVEPCGLKNLYVNSVEIMDRAKNNWLDNIQVLESGTHPIRIWGDHNTVRDSYIHRCYQKGPGGNCYVVTNGEYNLLYNNEIKRIRHLSIDNYGGNRVERYNVVVGNELTVDVNFHHGGNGNNLVEYNTISPLPNHHLGGYVLLTGHSPSNHKPPGPNNLFYNNDASNAGKPNAFGEQGVIYIPQDVDQDIREVRNAEPTCKTFYPMVPK